MRLAATTAKLDEHPREALSFMGTELVSFLCVCLLDGIVTNREGLTLLRVSLSQTKIFIQKILLEADDDPRNLISDQIQDMRFPRPDHRHRSDGPHRSRTQCVVHFS